MAFTQNDINQALQFAETVKLTATLAAGDGKTIEFHRSEDFPTGLDKDVGELLEIAIQYYQRSIFTGEYLMADEHPPSRKSGEPIDDINFFLSYYKDRLIEELKKAFNLDDSLQCSELEGPKMTPYAQAMLAYRKKMMKKQDN